MTDGICLLNVVVETESIGQSHIELSQRLLNELEKSVRDFREMHKGKRKPVSLVLLFHVAVHSLVLPCHWLMYLHIICTCYWLIDLLSSQDWGNHQKRPRTQEEMFRECGKGILHLVDNSLVHNILRYLACIKIIMCQELIHSSEIPIQV